MANTQCIYCSSSSYGKPCLFSPTDTHVHMDEPGKCIYCGSQQQGSGCVYNPYGSMHVKGPEFLNRSLIKTENALVLKYLFNKIKPSLIKEGYLSPLDRLYKRLGNIILNISQPLLEALSLQETPVYSRISKEDLIKTLEYKNKFKEIFVSLNKVVQEASLNIPPELVEEALSDAIMSQDEN